MRKHLTGLLFAVVLLLPAAVLAAPSVTIQLKPLRPATVRTTHELLVMDMKLDLVIDGERQGTLEAKRTETTRTKETVKIDKPDHRRFMVEYIENKRDEWSKDPDAGEHTTEEVEDVQGKVYVVDWTPQTGVRVEYPDGTSPPAAEVHLVEEGFSDMDEPHSRVARLLAGKKLDIGVPVTIPKEAMAELLGAEDDFTIDEFGMTLDRKIRVGGKPCAVFAADVILSKQEPGMQLVVEVAGEFIIRIPDGQVVSYGFTGPMTIAGDATEEGGPKMFLTGGGTMEAKAEASYSK
jgi:hypothetical protein